MRESGLQKANTADVSKQKNVARNAKPQKSILECFEHIVELAEDSNLDSDFFDTASTHIKSPHASLTSRQCRLCCFQYSLTAAKTAAS